MRDKPDEDYRGFRPEDRPDVEVLVEDHWCPGELRAWHLRAGVWWANVNYRTEPGQQYVDVVHPDRVRRGPEPPPIS